MALPSFWTIRAWWLPPLPPVARAGWAVLLALAWCMALLFGARLLAALAARWPAVERFRTAWLMHRNDRAGWALCAANWLLKLAVFALLLHALAPLDFAAALRGALGGELASVLPLQGPAGVGTYEAGVWAAALARGLDKGSMMVQHAFADASGAQVAAGALVLHAFAVAAALASAAILPHWTKAPD
jgi:hypothetical protein